jgi:hypothetical protein
VEELGIMLYIKKTEKNVLDQFVSHAKKILDPNKEFEVRGPHSPTTFTVPCIQLNSGADSPSASTRSKEAAKAPERSPARDAYRWFETNASDLLRRVDGRIGQLEELERSAKSTATMVRSSDDTQADKDSN